MRNKFVVLLLIVLRTGVITTPAFGNTGGDEEKPLSIAVWLDSGFLHVKAEEEEVIAAVYVNQQRVEYPNGGLSLKAAGYAGGGGKLSVYATDSDDDLFDD
jgi:hypothetical protein